MDSQEAAVVRDYEEMWHALESAIEEFLKESQLSALAATTYEDFLKRRGGWLMMQEVYEKLREIKQEP